MKLNKTIKEQLLADAMENIFGQEMDAFNQRCNTLVARIIPIHEKRVGPFKEIAPEYIRMSGTLYLTMKPGDRLKTRDIEVFKDKQVRRGRFKLGIHRRLDDNESKLSVDYVTLKNRTVVKVEQYGVKTLELHDLLQKHPAKLKAFQQYISDREAFIKKVCEMLRQLSGLINHCNTLKQLKDVWPDAFEQGILNEPESATKPMYLPSNIVRINELAGIKSQQTEEVA